MTLNKKIPTDHSTTLRCVKHLEVELNANAIHQNANGSQECDGYCW